MKRILTLWILLAFMGATAWCMTADELVKQTGVAGGFCSFPRLGLGEESLALELARRPSFVVHVMSKDVQAVARMRDAADAAGVLGRTLYVEQGDATALPYADRSVDLVVISELPAAELTPEIRKECLRVLTPARGAALLGHAAAIKVDLPAGADQWTHRCHGADNAQTSSDTVLKAPFLAQWWGMPRLDCWWGSSIVAANGRLFTLRDPRAVPTTGAERFVADKTDAQDPVKSAAAVTLTARSLRNGVVLWVRAVRPQAEGAKVTNNGYIPGRSCVVAVSNTLFLTDRDSVLRLDAETGAEQGRVAGPKTGGQIKWIGSANGLLVMLEGASDALLQNKWQLVANNPNGRELAVCDVASGRMLWHETAGADIDERMIALRNDQIYSFASGEGLTCRDARTGTIRWTNKSPDLQSDFKVPESSAMFALLYSQPGLLAWNDAVILRATWAKSIAAVSRVDGTLLWKKPIQGQSMYERSIAGLPFENLWVVDGKTAWDLKTGQAVKGPPFVSASCGPTTGTPGYMISCFGKVTDVKSGRELRGDDLKSPCDTGSLVCEGILVTVPSVCSCGYEMKGYRALASAGAIQPHTAPPWKDRLTVLDPAEPVPLAVTEADWPTYRRDPRRSGASTAMVGTPSKILWQWKPNPAPRSTELPSVGGPRLMPDYISTAPVAAAGLVWFASHDGVIHCVKGDSGKEVWKFPTGGMLFAPPTIFGGRLLAGGGDGRIYCLDASTGKCLWRLLAAPHDRRIFWFGHLISTWPVISGVAVQDGVAYAVAGYQMENGIHAYAINPQNGQVIWERDDAGTGGKAFGIGLSSLGNIALGNGRVWVFASMSPGSLDMKTGELDLVKTFGVGTSGCEVGLLDKWVFYGGRRLSEAQDTLRNPLSYNTFCAKSADGKAIRTLTKGSTTLPTWDADLVVMPPALDMKVKPAFTALPTAELTAWMAERSAVAAPAAGAAAAKPQEWWNLKTSWTLAETDIPADCMLSKDQVILTSAQNKAFQATGYRRTDGSKAWTIPLPDQPAMNRLAIDRDGRVLVSLCDGSIVCLGR